MEDSWDTFAFEERAKAWTRFENPRSAITRVQDLSFQLELSDDLQLKTVPETSPSWPFEGSPCRLFGGRNTRPNHKCQKLNAELFDVDFADHFNQGATIRAQNCYWNNESSLQTSRSFKRRTADENEQIFITEKRTDRRTSFERSDGSLTASYSELIKRFDCEKTNNNEQYLSSNHDRATISECECTLDTEIDELLDNSQFISSPLILPQELGWMIDGLLGDKTPALIRSQVIQSYLNIDGVSHAPIPLHNTSIDLPLRSPQPYGIKSPHQQSTKTIERHHSSKKLERLHSEQDGCRTCVFQHKGVLKLSSLPCTPVGYQHQKHHGLSKRCMSSENVEIPPESHDGGELIDSFQCQRGNRRCNTDTEKCRADNESSSTDCTGSSHSLGEEEEDAFAADSVTPVKACSPLLMNSQSSTRETFWEGEINEVEELITNDAPVQGRCFRQLFCDRSTIKVEDFVHRRNRSILHNLVYRHHLKVDMDALKAKLIGDFKTRDAGLALGRSPDVER